MDAKEIPNSIIKMLNTSLEKDFEQDIKNLPVDYRSIL